MSTPNNEVITTQSCKTITTQSDAVVTTIFYQLVLCNPRHLKRMVTAGISSPEERQPDDLLQNSRLSRSQILLQIALEL